MSDDVGATESATPEPVRAVANGDRLAWILLGPLTVALVTIIVVFYVFFSALQVDGPSMLPTLRDQDRLLLTHGYTDPTRGDIVSVHVVMDGGENDIIKRVIALPGDTIEIRRDVAFVNGAMEPQRGQVISADAAVNVAAQVVPKGMLYIMGDNRTVSEDSRFIGAVPQSGVKGRAVAVFSPVNRIRLIRRSAASR